LQVELMPESETRRETIEAELGDQLRLKTNLRYDLKFRKYGELPRYQVKANRFKDNRNNL
jgi:phenylacetate-CoA ligase